MWPLWIFVMPVSPGGLLPGPKEPGIAKESMAPGEHWPSQPISVIPQLLMEGGTVPLNGIAQGPWRCQQAQLQSPCPQRGDRQDRAKHGALPLLRHGR